MAEEKPKKGISPRITRSARIGEEASGGFETQKLSDPCPPCDPWLVLCSLVLVFLLSVAAEAETNWAIRIRGVADFLLGQQTPQGCVPDVPGGNRANQDSGMERSLLALAHAYRTTGQERYRRGLREGIEWLGAEMEKKDRAWAGSWFYAYSAKPPHVPLPTPLAGPIEDARGLTSTSALFVYLVALYTAETQDAAVARAHHQHVRVALDFLMERNRGPNHLFYYGSEREKGASDWGLCRMQYAADQADAYLGLRAGYWLLGRSEHLRAAEQLAEHVPRLLFDRKHRAFGFALSQEGKLVPPVEGPDGYLAQGYVAWAFGPTDEARDAIRWLKERQAPDNSIRLKASDPASTLAAAAFCLGAGRLGLYGSDRDQTMRWLRDGALTPQGGCRDVVAPTATVHNPLAGWITAAWSAADPFPFGPQPRPPDER